MYVATRIMTIGKEQRAPGCEVPEAVVWGAQTCDLLVKQGRMRDMTQEEKDAFNGKLDVETRIDRIKRAQKQLAKANADIAPLRQQLADLMTKVEAIEEKIEKYAKRVREAEADLKELDAVDMPLLTGRQQRAEFRQRLIDEASARAAAKREPPDDDETEDEPTDPEDERLVLHARLHNHTVPEIHRLIERAEIELPEERLRKPELIDFLLERTDQWQLEQFDDDWEPPAGDDHEDEDEPTDPEDDETAKD